MAQPGKNVGSLVLGEFVDDAKQSGAESRPAEDRSKTDCLNDLIRRIANDMAVPQYHLDKVVERVVAAVGPSIEERVRKELQEQMQSRSRNQGESLAG